MAGPNPIKFNQLVELVGAEIQETEDSGLDVLLERFLDNADGAQLDGVGQIVGENRLGRDDVVYLLAIRLRIFTNNGSGTPEQLLAIARQLVPDATFIRFYEVYPAKARIQIDGGTRPDNLQELLQAAAPAGVDLLVLDEGDLVFRVGRNRVNNRLRG